VRQNAASIEEVVMTQGNNPISLAEHPPTRGFIDPQKMPMRGVLVRQQVWQHTAKLLGYSGDRPGISVLPELKLRNILLVEATGVSRPITLCAPAKELDPSPCVSVHEVRLDNHAAYLDKGGAFHFVEHITMDDALDLAKMRQRFVLPISVGGRRLAQFDWRLYYERPADLVFSGPADGERGPNLGVSVDHRDPDRYILHVAGAGSPYLAIVENQDAPGYHVISRGAQGYTGDTGSSGVSGSSGSECQSGSDGGDGGPGGPGGPGGDGGDIAVKVLGGDEAMQMAQLMVRSEAGAGGEGGAGGAGGAGGSGGSSRSPTTHTDDNGNTVTDDPGCSAGSNGSSGSSGPDGPPGSPGRAGHVSFRLEG
jgi:hypothetical protein